MPPLTQIFQTQIFDRPWLQKVLQDFVKFFSRNSNRVTRYQFPEEIFVFDIIKVRLSSAKKIDFICFNENALKMMKNAFLKFFSFLRYLKRLES